MKVYHKSAVTDPTDEEYRQENSGSEWSAADFSEGDGSGRELEADAKQCRAQSVHEGLEVINPKEQPMPLHQKADIRVMKIVGAVNALVFLDTGSHLNLGGQTLQQRAEISRDESWMQNSASAHVPKSQDKDRRSVSRPKNGHNRRLPQRC